jgi:MCP family monocarboxylic acid transporter-like MFS transporter 10
MTFIPSLCVISHHFQRRRILVLGIVGSGASVGGVLHSIMLNQLFHGSDGFHKGVRASAGLNIGLFCLALSLMRTRLPPRKAVAEESTVGFFRDPPYVVMVLGYVRAFFFHSPICPQCFSSAASFSSSLIYFRSSFYNWTQ